jgi:hypothetical protein
MGRLHRMSRFSTPAVLVSANMANYEPMWRHVACIGMREHVYILQGYVLEAPWPSNRPVTPVD